MGTSERIAHVVEPILLDHGHELYDVELTGATVRVLVDHPGGAVTLADLEQLSREITGAEELDADLETYELEVSSPGLERPLRQPRHFAGAIGSLVKVKTVKSAGDADGERRVDGTLVSADDDGFTVETAAGARRLAYSDVERARTVFEWGPAAKPGSSARGNARHKKRSAS